MSQTTSGTTSGYAEAPVASASMPKGIPYIVGNEAAERFSFYGMKAILVVFMTQYLLGPDARAAFLSEAQAREYLAWFVASAYFFPIIGAVVADAFLGKYRTIMLLSIVYCIGHGLLACMDLPTAALQATLTPKGFLLAGLALIAIGSGGIKPCVSAHVGDQFGEKNKHLISQVFGWFYFAINFGSFFSTIMTPWMLEWYGPGLAFGIPGVLMAIATIVFWMGRHVFVHIPPRGWAFVRESFTGEGLRVILKLLPVYLFVAVFWSLYDQSGGAWVLQATKMDRELLGFELLESQVQAINPLLILTFIPIFSYLIYPAISKVFPLNPIRKISIGLFLTIAAFGISGLIETWIEQGMTPNIGWQLLAYVVLTAAEVMVSITCLEFSYTQAPPQMKSFVMSLYLLSVSAGNVFTATVNRFIQVDSPVEPIVAVANEARTLDADPVAAARTFAQEQGWALEPVTGASEAGAPDAIAIRLPVGGDELATVVISADAGVNVLTAPGSETLLEGAARVRTFFDAEERLPSVAEGGELVAGLTDVQGAPVGYVQIDTGRAELRSAGADGAPSTSDDVRLLIDASPARAAETVDPDAPLNWREKHVPGVLEQRGTGAATPASYETSLAIGGGTTLEGSNYYWFFTIVMAVAAVLFVFVGMRYRERTYIQGGDERSPDEEAVAEREAFGRTDD